MKRKDNNCAGILFDQGEAVTVSKLSEYSLSERLNSIITLPLNAASFIAYTGCLMETYVEFCSECGCFHSKAKTRHIYFQTPCI